MFPISAFLYNIQYNILYTATIPCILLRIRQNSNHAVMFLSQIHRDQSICMRRGYFQKAGTVCLLGGSFLLDLMKCFVIMTTNTII